MRIPRIYTPQPLHPDTAIELESEPSHHLIKVLRMETGRPLTLFNGNGHQYTATISAINKKTVHAVIEAQEFKPNLSPVDIELAIGLSKGDRFEWVLQKATELGVSKITPLVTNRSEVKLSGERLEKKMQSWRNVVINACEQCQRNVLPTLNDTQKISDFVENNTAHLKFVLHHRSEKRLEELTPPKHLSLLIGPEGGLDEEEINLATSNDFQPLKLGERVLRTETAPLAALSIMQYLWGDI